ncbi:MAG: hypothetical protein N3D75_03555 [Candidatus Aenigmarchaeota archaeon]|nr:hypothetical protein [Candidatus Aenigmarchaeota archaeon]
MRAFYLALTVLFLNVVFAADFELWAQRGGLFTIGENQIIKVYVLNKDSSQRDYTITYSKSATYNTNDVSHLLIVSFPSNRIDDVKPSETKSTELTVLIAAPISQGSITFTGTDDTGTVRQYTITDIRASYPQNLPEFHIIFLLLLFILASWKILKM